MKKKKKNLIKKNYKKEKKKKKKEENIMNYVKKIKLKMLKCYKREMKQF